MLNIPLKFEFPGLKDSERVYQADNVDEPNIPALLEAAERDLRTPRDEDGVELPLTSLCSPDWHLDDCPANEDQWRGCIWDAALKAERLKRNIGRLYALKICARHPHSANGWRKLEGMAQETCVYGMRYVLTAASS